MTLLLVWTFVMIPVFQPTTNIPGEVMVVSPSNCESVPKDDCGALYWFNENDCRQGRREYLGSRDHRNMYALNCFAIQYIIEADHA